MNADAELLTETPNGWRSMWFSPRLTIRRIVDAEVRPSWVPVIAVAALHNSLTAMQLDPSDGTLSISRSVMPVVLGGLQLVFGVLVGPFLLAFVGGWLGGEADPSDIRQAVAWSYVPYASATVVWIPILMLAGTRAFGQEVEAASTGLSLAVLLLVLGIFVATIWTFVLHVITLAEVQRFSIVRALASVLILLIPVLLLGALR